MQKIVVQIDFRIITGNFEWQKIKKSIVKPIFFILLVSSFITLKPVQTFNRETHL